MSQTSDGTLKMIIERLFQEHGVDFRDYKPTTLRRRVQRRIDDTGCPDMSAYLDLLERNPEEYSKLLDTLLINVTEFFREPEAWEVIRTEVIPRIMAEKHTGDQIKVWSAGCATGEEAYALAMLFADAVECRERPCETRIYATDIDEGALAIARRGRYDDKAMERVPADLRERYFTGDGLQTVKRELRKTVIFGNHNLVTDAPISHCDLIVCRNVLIYMSVKLQDRVLSKFHYALDSPGFLFLGKAEAMLSLSGLFGRVNERARIFVKESPGGAAGRTTVEQEAVGAAVEVGAAEYQLVSLFNEAVLRHAPVGVIAINGNNIVRVMNAAAERMWGVHTRDLLGKSIAEASLPPSLVEVAARAVRVRQDRKEYSVSDLCLSDQRGKELYVSVRVTPMFDVRGGAGGAIILTEDVTAEAILRCELEVASEEMHATNEELETTNEELQSTNEELVTTNEELQSTNEELETTNEELQSTNEELETTNDELEARTAEARRLAEDREKAHTALQLVNDLAADFLSGASLEHSLHSMLSTAQEMIPSDAASIEVYDDPDILRAWVFSLGEGECTMPQPLGIGDAFPAITAKYRRGVVVKNDIAKSDFPSGHIPMRNLLSVGVEVRGGWAHLVLANKEGGFTEDDIQKAELLARFATLIIDRSKLDESERAARAEAETRAGELQQAKARLETILDTIPAGVMVTEGPEGKLTLANPRASELYGYPMEAGGRDIDLIALTTMRATDGRVLGPDEVPSRRAVLNGEIVRDEEIVVQHFDGRKNTLLVNSAPMRGADGRVTAAVTGFLDITAIKETQARLTAAYEHEHRIAETLQKALIPEMAERVGDLVVNAKYQAASEEAEVGGDFYHSARLRDDRFFVALGDVSGKGLEAAVLGAMARYMLSGFASETPDPDILLHRLNEALSGYCGDGMFITLAYVLFDLKANRARIGSAGHEPAIHFSRSTGKTVLLPPVGRVLGITPGEEYTSHEFAMDTGDLLLLYTDGLSEAGTRAKPLMSEGIAAMLAEQASEEPDKILDYLHETAVRISGGKLTDDATSVLVKRNA